MVGKEPIEVNCGDIVEMRRAHPCGSFEWKIVRIGADIGMVCVKCGRRVDLDRTVFMSRLRRLKSER